MKTRSNLVFEFAPYRLDSGKGKLFRSGEEVKLRPRVFELLCVLVRHHGQMLEKDQLMDLVWPDVEVEMSNIAVSINELRRELGEAYIETVARRGYRFVAEVKVIDSDSSMQSQPPPPGGAVPLDSLFYIPRKTDEEFYQALGRRDSIVLVKGARQVGKTSLLARGLQKARESGAVVVLTDLQHLSSEAFVSLEKFLLALGSRIADQLELKTKPHDAWSDLLAASSNFEIYLRRGVLARLSAPLLWGLDEIDRLFGFDYATEVFGLFRSWHNLRALEPAGPWKRMTMAMAYATEAHLFITDLNQSPFNVGTKLTLGDFTLDEIAELNRRYGAPLKSEAEVARYFALVGGHPYLGQRGFYEMSERGLSLDEIEAKADRDEWIFGEHLRRMLVSLTRDMALCDAVRNLLKGKPGLTITNFYRLRSAGVITGDSAQEAVPRCKLYTRFLEKHLL